MAIVVHQRATHAVKPFNKPPNVNGEEALSVLVKDKKQAIRSVIKFEDLKQLLNGTIKRYTLAYLLIQSLGLEEDAIAATEKPMTVQMNVNGSVVEVEVSDADAIPKQYRGYVKLALDKKMLLPSRQSYNIATRTFTVKVLPSGEVTREEYDNVINRMVEGYYIPR